MSLNQDGQLIENISNALKQYNQALSIVKAEVVDNVCLDLEIESKEELKRVNLLFVTATVGKELNRLNKEPIELVNLTVTKLKGVNTEVIWTREIYKTPDVNQSTSFSQNSENKKSHSNLIPIIVVGIILFGSFQIYRNIKKQELMAIRDTSCYLAESLSELQGSIIEEGAKEYYLKCQDARKRLREEDY